MPGFSSSYSPLFLALFMVIAAAVSYYFYRNTAVEKNKKALLIALKTAAIFILLALFIEPVLSYLTGNSSSRKDIVLIDISRSNTLEGKQEQIDRVIKEAGLFKRESDVFGFSSAVIVLKDADSISYNGYSTDLVTSLRSIKENFPDGSYNSVTLLTDGIFTDGSNPVYEAMTFNAPFVIFPVGDTAEKKDIILKSIVRNEKAFTGTPVKIRVFLTINKAGTESTVIKLQREGSEIRSHLLNFEPGKTNYEAEFEVTENTPGKIKYRITVENIPGELTYKNNHNDFFITFIDNKVNILVVSGGPGYDNEFTGSVLKRIGNYNITYRTQKSAGDFYEGPIDYRQFAELSTLFMLNYPTNVTSSAMVSEISTAVKQFNVPVVFFAGKNTDYQKLSTFDEQIPFSAGRINQGENLFRLQPVTLSENSLANIPGLGSTNEIFRNIGGIMPKPGSVTLATDKASGEPVIINRVNGNLRSTAFLGYGLWRWKLNPGTNAEKTLEAMLLELINMTLQKEKRTKLRVYPSKDIFDYTESPKIYAEVYDENFAMTRNAVLTGRIVRKDGSNAGELRFTPEENRFSAVLPPLAAGDYSIEAEAEYNGNYWARDVNRFLSDTVNTEFIETRSNFALLSEIASKTGGTMLHDESSGSYGELLKGYRSLPGSETVTERYLRFDLWSNKYYLMLVILLFSVEWILRKRNNIP